MRHDQLPNNPQAEQGVLAALLYRPNLIVQVADKLKPDDFYCGSLRHQHIYEAMLHLYHEEIEIDTATLTTELERKGITTIKDVHPMSYIHDLWQIGMEEAPSLKDDANLVLNCATQRRLYGFLYESGDILRSEPNAQKAIERIAGLLSSINEETIQSDLKPMTAIMDAFVANLNRRETRKGELTGIPTGLDGIDRYLQGLQKGDFYVLGGLPGSGKTSLMLNFLRYMILKLKLHIAVFSIEMPELDLATRLVSMDADIDSQLLRARWIEDDQWERIIASAFDRLYKDNIAIDDSGDLTINAMQTKLDRYRAKNGLDLVIVDYLQLMQSDDEKTRENEVQQLSKISRGLKKIAKRFNVPVLALASLNRDSAKRANKRHQLSDFRGCGSIEFDCDVAMFIMPSEEREGVSLVNIEKHRNGPKGDVFLKFNPSLTRFSNVDDTEEETAQ